MFLDRWLEDTKPHALHEGRSATVLRVCSGCAAEAKAARLEAKLAALKKDRAILRDEEEARRRPKKKNEDLIRQLEFALRDPKASRTAKADIAAQLAAVQQAMLRLREGASGSRGW